MSYDIEHIDDLIGKYLAGEAAQDEVHFVELWAQESEGNRKYLAQCKTIFEKAGHGKLTHEFDADAAWVRLKSKVQQPVVQSISADRPKLYLNSFWKVAASVIFLIGIGFFVYEITKTDLVKTVEVVADNGTKADTLPDGSGVFLNRESQLIYSYNKKEKSHVVKLKGEAYFSIHHDDDKPFIIDAAGVFIKDIGTSFNVKAYPDSNTVEVVVEEGKVMFYTTTDSGIYLSADGKGTYNKTTKTFTIEQPDENVLAYKTKFFSFTETDLRSIVAALNNVYDKKIVVDQNLYNCHLTVSFNNESIDEIAAIIAETLGITVKNSANQIRLEGAGCGQ